ncbi:tail fiber protein [Erwinia phage Derbicus]|uniref:Putative tail fiber protein n=2 Tax=Derbicusvirus derbicus TaxID=2734104 RepID=A0A482ILN5_9CAUD|nr:tail fiber protein [Erwinia phage vB_EamM_EarlPhillipIV]YP_009821258.1 tail fiber protein [Erwinia phage Derbicus]ANZ49064.1 putative tail fiber protein [Erwinia phage vB_EamM_EarlPhillipIV]QBP07640.1 putative tail fiber protein [Erwinia phage Derbicus]
MAKKNGIDDIDLDNMDDFDDFDEPPRQQTGKSRNPILDTARTARKSALDSVFPDGERTRIIMKGMPKATEDAYEGYKNVADAASDVFSHTKEELVKTERALKMQTRQMVPTMRKYLPKMLVNPVEKWAKNVDLGSGGQDYDPQQAAIDRMMSDVFSGGGDAPQSQAEQREMQEDAVEDKLRSTIETMKGDQNQGLLIQIAKDIRLTTNLQKGVMINVQRKQLELSYRQLFALQDIAKLKQSEFDRNTPALEAIVKNTALPDYAKEEFGEITGALMKRKIAEWISPARYAETFIEQIRDNMKKKISNVLTEGRGISDMLMGSMIEDDMDLDDQSELSPDKQRTNLAQKGVGLGVGFLSKRFINPLRDKMLGKVRSRLEDHQGANTFANRAAYNLMNLPMIANSAISGERESGLGNVFKVMNELGIAPSYKREKIDIGGRDGEMLAGVAKFDRRTWLSINEVIPAWLAEINRSIRWGYGETVNQTYDLTTRGFVDKKVVGNRVRKHVAADAQRERQRTRINEVIDMFDTDKSMTNDQRQKLGAFLEDRISTAREFNAEALLKDDHVLGRFMGAEGTMKVKDLIQKQSNGTGGAAEFSNKINSEMRGLRAGATSYQKRVEEARAIYGDRALIDSGLFRYDPIKDELVPDGDLTDIYTTFGTLESGKTKSGRSLTREQEIARKLGNGSAMGDLLRDRFGTSGEDLGAGSGPKGKGKRQKGRPPKGGGGIGLSVQELSGVLYGGEMTNFPTLMRERALSQESGTGAGGSEAIVEAIRMHSSKDLVQQILEHVKSMDEQGILLNSGEPDYVDEGPDQDGSGETSDQRNSRRRRAKRRAKRRRIALHRTGGLISQWFGLMGETAGKGVEGIGRGIRGGYRGLRSLGNKVFGSEGPGFFSKALKFGKDGVLSGFRGVGAMAKAAIGARDIYNSNGDVVLEGNKLKNGQYFQKINNITKAVYKIDDINLNGNIYDPDGKVVVTKQTLQAGGELSYYKGGRWWKVTEVLGSKVGGLANTLVTGLGKGFGGVGNIAKRGKDWFTNYPDMYVGNEQSPRIRANMMREGEYLLQKGGKVIYRPDDITGAVVNRKGDVIISEAEVANPNFKLVDRWGRAVRTPLGRMVGRITGIGRFALDKLSKIPGYVRGMNNRIRNSKWVTGVKKSLGDNFITRWLNKDSGSGDNNGWFRNNTIFGGGPAKKTNHILIRIYKLLNARMTGEPEDESWIKELGEEPGANGKRAKEVLQRARRLARIARRRAQREGVAFRDKVGSSGWFNRAKAKGQGFAGRVRGAIDSYRPDRFDDETKQRILESLEGRDDDVAEYYRERLMAKGKINPKLIRQDLDEDLANLADRFRGRLGALRYENSDDFMGPRRQTHGILKRLGQRAGRVKGGIGGYLDGAKGRLDAWRHSRSDDFVGPKKSEGILAKLTRLVDISEASWFNTMRQSSEEAGMPEGMLRGMFSKFGQRVKFNKDGEKRDYFRWFRRRKEQREDGEKKKGFFSGLFGKKEEGGKGMLMTIMGGLWTAISGLSKGIWGLTKIVSKFALGGAWKAATKIGGALLSPLAWLGRGALAAGSAIVTAVGWPVILGVAAAGAALWGGYKLATREPTRYLDRMRLAQYGFRDYDLWSSDDGAKAKYLEDQLRKYVAFAANGEASLRGLSAQEAEKVSVGFGIDPENKGELIAFHAFAQQRFIPIYLRWLTAIRQLQSAPRLEDLGDDKKVSKEDMKTLFGKLALDKDSPFLKTLTDPRKVDRGWMSKTWDAVTFSDPDLLSADEVISVQKEVESDIKRRRERRADRIKRLANKETFIKESTAVSDQFAEIRKDDEKRKENEVKDGDGKSTDIIEMQVEQVQAQKKDLDALQSVRLKTYGLKTLEPAQVKSLLLFEDAVLPCIDKRSGKFEGKIENLLNGLVPGVMQTNRKSDLMTWFTFRFLPAYVTYVLAVARYAPAANPNRLVLSGGYLYEVALMTSRAQADRNGFKESVWTIPINPFGGPANDDAGTITDELATLKELSKKADMAIRNVLDAKSLAKRMGSKGGKVYENGGSGGERERLDSALYNSDQTGGSADALRNNVSNTISAANTGISGNGGVTGGNVPDIGNDAFMRDQGLTMGEGGQGDYMSIRQSGRSIQDIITAACRLVGIPPLLGLTIAMIESGMNPSIKAKGSSATGLFQFTSGTWDDMMKRYANQYGIPAGTSPKDPVANAILGALYLKEGHSVVKQKTGSDPSATSIYMHHFLGAGGVSQFLNAMRQNPNGSAAAAMPKAATANPSIFYDKSGNPRSFAQVYNLMRQKVSAAEANVRQFAPGSTSLSGPEMGNVPAENAERRDEVIEQKGARDGQAIAESAGASSVPNPAGVKASDAPPDMSQPMSTAAEGVSQTYPTVSPEQKEKYQAAAQTAAVGSDPVSSAPTETPASVNDNSLSIPQQSLNVQRQMLTQLITIATAVTGGASMGGAGDRSAGAQPSAAPGAKVVHGEPTIATNRITTQ